MLWALLFSMAFLTVFITIAIAFLIATMAIAWIVFGFISRWTFSIVSVNENAAVRIIIRANTLDIWTKPIRQCSYLFLCFEWGDKDGDFEYLDDFFLYLLGVRDRVRERDRWRDFFWPRDRLSSGEWDNDSDKLRERDRFGPAPPSTFCAEDCCWLEFLDSVVAVVEVTGNARDMKPPQALCELSLRSAIVIVCGGLCTGLFLFRASAYFCFNASTASSRPSTFGLGRRYKSMMRYEISNISSSVTLNTPYHGGLLGNGRFILRAVK